MRTWEHGAVPSVKRAHPMLQSTWQNGSKGHKRPGPLLTDLSCDAGNYQTSMHTGSAATRKHLQTSMQSTTMPALEHRSGSNTCMPGWPTAERATTGRMPINVPGHANMAHHAFNSAQVTHPHTQDTAYARHVHQGALGPAVPCQPARLLDGSYKYIFCTQYAVCTQDASTHAGS